MKHAFIRIFIRTFVILAFLMVFSGNYLFAQEADEDDTPYLLEDDIRSVEAILPEDIPETPVQYSQQPETSEEVIAQESEEVQEGEEAAQESEVIAQESEAEEEADQNESSRLNNQRKMYHILVLDRTDCDPDADVSGITEESILYKFTDDKNGYLVLVYTVFSGGPEYPEASYVILNLMSNRINTLREYVRSAEFKRFITNKEALSGINGALK